MILQSIINEDPEYVIKRCESGKFAVNDDVITLYFKVKTVLLYSCYIQGVFSISCDRKLRGQLFCGSLFHIMKQYLKSQAYIITINHRINSI